MFRDDYRETIVCAALNLAPVPSRRDAIGYQMILVDSLAVRRRLRFSACATTIMPLRHDYFPYRCVNSRNRRDCFSDVAFVPDGSTETRNRRWH